MSRRKCCCAVSTAPCAACIGGVAAEEYDLTFANLSTAGNCADGNPCTDCETINGLVLIVPGCSGLIYLSSPLIGCLHNLVLNFLADSILGSGYMVLVQLQPYGLCEGFGQMQFYKHYDTLIDCLGLDDDVPFYRVVGGDGTALCNHDGAYVHINVHAP